MFRGGRCLTSNKAHLHDTANPWEIILQALLTVSKGFVAFRITFFYRWT